MFGQTFQTADLGVIAFLVLLEGLLSADNALVLAIMVKHLPPEQRSKALLYGLGGAFIFRLVAILAASSVIALWWLQALGALYLLYLPLKHFIQSTQGAHAKPVNAGFWKTVVLVELTDIAFAIDSVLAAVALVSNASKVWVVYTGAMIGIVLLRFAARAIIGLIERFPTLDHLAYVLIAWVAVKLGMTAGHNFVTKYNEANDPDLPFIIPTMPQTLFWVMMVMILMVGVTLALRRPVSESTELSAPDPPSGSLE